ncbi:MAG: amidase family protein [Parvularcula sp.]|jgi:Asp-tRNA(Asn)/Glu-tRNA(Gln) amidotransferase A subunit family amidase|nr:amidase family protein [Parvularcula sp.]
MLGIDDYLSRDGMALAELVANGDAQRAEIIDCAQQACEAVNDTLNAIVLPMFDHARDRLGEAGTIPSGPLSGAPIVMKDEYQSVAGVPTSQSARLARGWTRDYDTALVERYHAAGIQIVGKANLPEFGASVTTEPVATGPTNNPWDLSRNTGGSSGGSAASVAAGIVPIAYSTDGAGSIRIPSSCCGTFGLKPTRARTPTGPDGYEYWNGLCLEHAITRSVRDSAALLDATDAFERGAPYPAPPKTRPFLQEVGRDPGSLKIGISVVSPLGNAVDAVCRDAAEDTARLCESLGHRVEWKEPVFDAEAMTDAMKTLLRVHLALGIADLAELMGRQADAEAVESAHWQLAQQGEQISAPAFLAALETLGQVARKAAAFWAECDLWLTPTLARLPLPHGTIYANDPDPEKYIRDYFEFVPFTPLANVTGNPAMSVPLYWSDEGLPVGTHFTADFGAEDVLFRLAAQLENARPWAGKTPPHGVKAALAR